MKPSTSPPPHSQQDNSSPLQGGHSPIPGDVILEIARHLGPSFLLPFSTPVWSIERHDTLRSLALACREYHRHLLPFLFDTMLVQRGLKQAVKSGNSRNICARFCKSLIEGDERAQTLATYVKTYTIVDFSPDEAYTDQDLAYSSKPMALFPNLQELHVSGLWITNHFLTSAASLPPLRVLRIEGCRVPKPLDKVLLKKFSSLQVMHLYDRDMYVNIDGDARASQENNQSQEFLRHYPMSHTKYLSSGRTHCHFLNGLATSHLPMDNLECVKFALIEIDEVYPKALSDFLKKLPALKSLDIEEVEYQIDDPEEFTLEPYSTYSTPPRLEHLHAQLCVLMSIIPGSSVSSIGIASEDIFPEMPLPIYSEKGLQFWKPYVIAFKRSQRPIVSMNVPINLYTSVCFAKNFPALQTLTVQPKHWNWYQINDWQGFGSIGEVDNEDAAADSGPAEIIALFLKAWKSHPKLTELRFLYGPLDNGELTLPVIHEPCVGGGTTTRIAPWKLSEDTLNNLRQRIPSLKLVTFINRKHGVDDEVFEFSVC